MRLASTALLLGVSLAQAAGTSAQVAPRHGVAEAPDGVSISYQTRGTQGLPLVFIHGWACDQSYWSDQLAYFAARARVVTVDLAGHGESGANRYEWSIARFAEDVVAVLHAEDLRGAVLIGHSLGGPVALEAALLSEARVTAVVGVDTFFDVWLQPGLYTSVLERMRSDFVSATREWVTQVSFIETTPPSLVERIAVDMSLHPWLSGTASLAELGEWGPSRMRQAFEILTLPLGVIQSSGAIAGLEVVRAQRNRLPTLRVVEMDGVGHFMMSEDPSRFNTLLWDLIVDLRQGS